MPLVIKITAILLVIFTGFLVLVLPQYIVLRLRKYGILTASVPKTIFATGIMQLLILSVLLWFPGINKIFPDHLNIFVSFFLLAIFFSIFIFYLVFRITFLKSLVIIGSISAFLLLWLALVQFATHRLIALLPPVMF